MRTKTLLVAAAALAATVISSEAQVYSGVVGYINVTNVPGQLTLIANPLDNGTNTLNSLFPSVANGSVIQTWNGTGFSSSTKLPAGWSPNTLIPPGEGFFVKITAAITNTFVGSVVAPVGGSVTNSLPGGILELVGSPLPYQDTLNGTNLALKVLPNGSTIQIWNGSGYSSSTKLPAGWSPNATINLGEGFFVKSGTSTNWVESLPSN